jgi:hypothetical protein
LAIDQSDHPHISYYDYASQALKHTWRDGAAWHIEAASSAGDEGQHTSLALDSAGQPHISYLDGDSHTTTVNLGYAWYGGGAWHTESVDTGAEDPWYGVHTSLAVDTTGHPHISYMVQNYPISILKYAWRDGTCWHTETLDDEGMTGRYSSLALDGADNPHIAYYDSTQRDLKYAWRDGAGWRVETVDSQGNVGRDTSLAIDGMGHPHIAYLDDGDALYIYSDDSFKYAWHDGTKWHIQTVISATTFDTSISLALDKAGRPHLSYLDTPVNDGHYSSENYLKHAWYDGTAWHVEVADSGRNVVSGTSLALDEADHPHISYRTSDHDELRHAWHDGTGWYTETVASAGHVYGPTAMALDKAGRPHITYYYCELAGTSFDPYCRVGNLRYVWHDGTTWHVQTLVSEGIAGEFNSLAIDELGDVHVSFHDESANDLKYVHIPPLLSLDKQAEPITGLLNNETLAYTSTFTCSMPSLSFQLWDPLPANVRYVVDSITGTITPAAVYSPTLHTIAWQGTPMTGTVGTIRFQVTPGITGTRALSLSQPIVNAAWLTDTEHDRSISSTIIVNGYHLYLPLYRLSTLGQTRVLTDF